MANGGRHRGESATSVAIEDMSEQPLTTEEIRNRVKTVQAVRFGDVLPHPHNPKDHHPEQREAFRGAVRDVGFTSIPIAYHSERHNGKLTWADGHLRGSEVADYVGQVAILDIDDKEADYVIATTDPIAGMVRYDNEKLDALLREVSSGSAAVMDMLAGLAEGAGLYLDEKPIGAGGDEFDTEPQEGETRAKRGDLWQMGEHRLLVDDCTVKANVERLMGGEKAEMVFTDPPYGVDYTGGHFHSGNVNIKRERERLGGDTDTAIYAAFLSSVLPLVDGACYVWFADSKARDVYNAVFEQRGEIHALIIWHKVNAKYAAMNAQYKQRHEPCLYFKPKGSTLRWVGASDECTLWEIKRDAVNDMHPTQKPIDLSPKGNWRTWTR